MGSVASHATAMQKNERSLSRKHPQLTPCEIFWTNSATHRIPTVRCVLARHQEGSNPWAATWQPVWTCDSIFCWHTITWHRQNEARDVSETLRGFEPLSCHSTAASVFWQMAMTTCRQTRQTRRTMRLADRPDKTTDDETVLTDDWACMWGCECRVAVVLS